MSVLILDRAGIAPAKLVPLGQVTRHTPLPIAQLGFAREFAISASLRVISVSLSTPPIQLPLNPAAGRFNRACTTAYTRTT